ncbi:MAG TPA: hypothetical protein VMO00_09755, partial [Methylomirabilota bacterium]|nr:hypothetical protein [Methylomirabilota bacterium]
DEMGFLNLRSPLKPPEANEVVLGVFGGSVSHQVSSVGLQPLLAELKKMSFFRSKKFVTLRFGLGAYKQPQTVLALAYLISIGVRFDIIVNLDGFNEITLPFVGNIPFGTSPFYPVYWQSRVPTGASSQALRGIGSIEIYETFRRRYARFMFESPLHYSNAADVAWFLTDRLLGKWVMETRGAVTRQDDKPKYLARHGPASTLQTRFASYEGVAQNWATSSLEMERLARLVGAHYYHFLQPNQYLPGTKTLTVDELNEDYDPKSPYLKHVKEGYPYLQRASERLIHSNVRFVDLTGIFRRIPETVYSDKCCHFNLHGAEILGQAIGVQIRQWYTLDALKH